MNVSNVLRCTDKLNELATENEQLHKPNGCQFIECVMCISFIDISSTQINISPVSQ